MNSSTPAVIVKSTPSSKRINLSCILTFALPLVALGVIWMYFSFKHAKLQTNLERTKLKVEVLEQTLKTLLNEGRPEPTPNKRGVPPTALGESRRSAAPAPIMTTRAPPTALSESRRSAAPGPRMTTRAPPTAAPGPRMTPRAVSGSHPLREIRQSSSLSGPKVSLLSQRQSQSSEKAVKTSSSPSVKTSSSPSVKTSDTLRTSETPSTDKNLPVENTTFDALLSKELSELKKNKVAIDDVLPQNNNVEELSEEGVGSID